VRRACFSALQWARKVMSKFKIELVSKLGGSVIGAAIDAESALKVMDEAMRLYRTGHIQIRCGATICAERMPPRVIRGRPRARKVAGHSDIAHGCALACGSLRSMM
jgi:hypothetical protein